MSAPKPCRRCLLADMDDDSAKKTVKEGIDAILESDRADEKVYDDRLSF